jgi:hypothetical protein
MSAGAASSATAQSYEPNDTYISAFGPVTAGVDYSAATETENDEDYYFFYLPQRTQTFFTLTNTSGTDYSDAYVCGEIISQTRSSYDYIADSELVVYAARTATAAVTLDRGKYFVSVGCADADETYTFRITPPGATSTYEPFASACALANAPVVSASQHLATAKARLVTRKRKLANARGRGAGRSRLRVLKARVRVASAGVKAAKRTFNGAAAAEHLACSVPM